MCECLIKVLRDCESDVYKQKLSGFGLMDRGIYLWLDQIATCFNEVPLTETSKIHELMTALKPNLEMYGRMLCLMLRNNVHECLRFREMRAHQSLYVITDVMIAGDILATPFDVTDEFHLSENQFSVMAAFAELAGNLQNHRSCHRRDRHVKCITATSWSRIGFELYSGVSPTISWGCMATNPSAVHFG